MNDTAAADIVIEAHGVGRAFRGRGVLAAVDLSVARGEIFGVLGPDGAGKTTLMQILAAILDPSAGACRVLGFDIVREAAAITARIGYMSQGDEVIAAGAKGILFRSRFHEGGTNRVIYPDTLGATDALVVLDPGAALPKNQDSWT